MDNAEIAEMLVLAGLTYRGALDPAGGATHAGNVEGAVAAGLAAYAPRWQLVWGPATDRKGDLFDSSAMYVVRGGDPEQYVIAVRGTNPVSGSDWLRGDLAVATTVKWPFGNDGAAVSTSTALGLRSLLRLRSSLPNMQSLASRLFGRVLGAVGMAVTKIPTLEPAIANGFYQLLATRLNELIAEAGIPGKLGQLLAAASQVSPQEIEAPKTAAQPDPQTLFGFLAARSKTPMRVTVTGHSKGGALAPTLALWLKETQTARGDNRGWDDSGQASIRCVTFAGPTPGNAAFAKRIESTLPDHHRIANDRDIVTHAWEKAQLAALGPLYPAGKALFDEAARDLAGLDYQHAKANVPPFSGQPLHKDFLLEVIHQHLDAYLIQFGLHDRIKAVTFFIG
jgi:hypothetical protein